MYSVKSLDEIPIACSYWSLVKSDASNIFFELEKNGFVQFPKFYLG